MFRFLIKVSKKCRLLKPYPKNTIIIRFIKDKKEIKTIPKSSPAVRYVHWRSFQPQEEGSCELSIYENRGLDLSEIKYICENFFKYYILNSPCNAYCESEIQSLINYLKENNFEDVIDIEPYPFPHFLHGNIHLKLDKISEDKLQLLQTLLGRKMSIGELE